MQENHLQALMDGMSANWQRDRAEEQMTLGGIIELLEAMPDGSKGIKLGDLDSYRGYYCDLAFEPTEEEKPVNQLLSECKDAMGQVFTGYKGGDYVMGALTPLWVSHYGTTGDKLVGISENGELELADDD